jgi:hypothetical protein
MFLFRICSKKSKPFLNQKLNRRKRKTIKEKIGRGVLTWAGLAKHQARVGHPTDVSSAK